MVPEAVLIHNFERWPREVLLTGSLAEDGGVAIEEVEAVARQRRYVELLELVDGSEGQEVFQTLLDSMQTDEDFEVYENTRRVLGRFPGDRFGRWLFEALPDFMRRRGTDDIEDFLAAIAAGNLGPEAPNSFNDAWAKAETAWSDQVLDVVRRLEHHGSLSLPGRVGKLRPAP